MTKLDALKAALAASTQGEWTVKQTSSMCNNYVKCDKGYSVIQGYSSPSMTQTYRDGWNEAEGNATFAALAHNTMPQLLEAVERLAWITEFCAEHVEWFGGSDPATGAEAEWLHDSLLFLEDLK